MEPDTRPATKADLADVKTEIEDRFRQLDENLVAWKDEIKRHFDVVAERNRHDMVGTRRDEIEQLKDSKKDHETRIQRLEKAAGVAA